MRFNGLDFMSSPPQSFIFQKKTNKTNFGGVLSLLYLLTFLVVSIFYIVSYVNQDNFSIQYLFQEKYLTSEDTSEMYKSERFNPTFNFCVSVTINGKKEYEDRFQVRRYNGFLYSELNTSKCHNIKVPDINWFLAYDCGKKNNSECQKDLDNLVKLYNTDEVSLNMYFNGFKIDHQNKTSPLYMQNGQFVSHSLLSKYHLFNPSYQVHTWNSIRYKEQKRFFSFLKNDEDENKDYIGLGMKSFYYSEMSGLKGDKIIFQNLFDTRTRTSHNYRIFGRIRFDVDFYHYDEYKRTPKSFWDNVAKICSLCMTIFNALCSIFDNLFSNNFDYYKILEKIFNDMNHTPKKNGKENKETNEPTKDLKKDENLTEKANDDNNLLLPINEDIDDEEGQENNNNKDTIDNNEKEQENNKKDSVDDKGEFPNLKFFDFLFSGIYNNKCCKRNINKLIKKCNEIIMKYFSVESIVYNQIKLENLLKDYSWNDERLNEFNNNDLIMQLKNLVSSFNNG